MTGPEHVSTAQLSAPNQLILKTLVEAIPSIVFLVDWIPGQGTDRSTLYLSPYVERLTGVPADEVLVKPGRIEKLIHPDHVESFSRSFSKLLESGEGKSETEYRFWNEKQQEWRWMLEHLRLLPGERPGTKRILGMVIDITRQRENEEQLRRMHKELKERQAQLIKQEKMASLGLLAAGVAHEINNPVGYASSNIETLKGDLKLVCRFAERVIELAGRCNGGNGARSGGASSGGASSGGARSGGASSDGADEATKDLLTYIKRFSRQHELAVLLGELEQMVNESLDGLNRVQDIVVDLKSFARPEQARLEDCDLNQQVEAALTITRGKIVSKCEIDLRLAPLPRVKCSPGQMTQVFANLLINAAEAIPVRGRVRIESFHDGDEVVVAISDTGKGIEPQHLDDLFSPFFTTKPVGEGTGLGLSVSYGIVSKHKGTIDVQSVPGEGSTFSVRLPIDHEQARPGD